MSRECGGNPLLAIELARAEAAGESGQSLREVVQERLARFDADGGQVLRWAAVLAPRIDAASLARLTGLDWNAIGEPLETAARNAMLLPVEVLLAAAPVEDTEAAAGECAALAEQALDLGAIAHARRGYYMASYVHWMHGDFADAREEALQAERVARGGSDEEHIAGMAEAARCLAMIERDLPQADAMLMEAQALAARKGMRHNAIPAALGMLRFHENKLDESTELFKEARTLARACGDRLNEFQASEYLAMIDVERGRPEAACAHCRALVELGDKRRDGSERPFAHALDALCHYAIADDSAPLDAALGALRAADAKQRLAYTLSRAALLDIERQRPAAAIERATEALAYAEALDRPTEILLARAVLERAHTALDADGRRAPCRRARIVGAGPRRPLARERIGGLRR